MPSTTFENFVSKDESIYVKFQQNLLVGFIHIGSRTINYKNQSRSFYKLTANCVIDFWLYDKIRRKGNGKVFQII